MVKYTVAKAHAADPAHFARTSPIESYCTSVDLTALNKVIDGKHALFAIQKAVGELYRIRKDARELRETVQRDAPRLPAGQADLVEQACDQILSYLEHNAPRAFNVLEPSSARALGRHRQREGKYRRDLIYSRIQY
ncbi:hypothetical protein JCM3775_007191 [Rhodotorula graminis]|uniref:Uncharacterized protein n=1 Tax=Rhodotorula graminis (strain WP1) TaxID=578459 RepID=A0A0P9EI31_RHOGW|nr:uncharacterized protein RHOBADRAFT_46525 [Rhodotorula graminis WP1]KPV72934.1 hypothetical protein RHOBADRAFT_46525 [Rhodotorula graminis WP1]